MAAHFSRNYNFLVQAGVSLSMMAVKSTLSVTKTVQELLFEGYSDPFISSVSKIPILSQRIPIDKIALFYKVSFFIIELKFFYIFINNLLSNNLGFVTFNLKFT